MGSSKSIKITQNFKRATWASLWIDPLSPRPPRWFFWLVRPHKVSNITPFDTFDLRCPMANFYAILYMSIDHLKMALMFVHVKQSVRCVHVCVQLLKRLSGLRDYSYSERLQKLNLQNLELRRIHYTAYIIIILSSLT